jgi:excinuclease ABC subunit C
MTPQEFSILANTIPTQPGIYKYYDAANELIYVGKAKHLRKRVSSYFSKNKVSYKTMELVSRIKRGFAFRKYVNKKTSTKIQYCFKR